jgi:hypothetical protein
MPVEIKELKIKAVVIPSDAKAISSEKEKISYAELERIKREIKRECMQELKQFIKDQKER